MAFETELLILKDNIARAESVDELNYLRATNEKKYWWTSIFICGLFYALNDDVGKMIISWILSFFTLGIYFLWTVYTSYRDETEFNNQMEYAILRRTRQLNNQTNTSQSAQNESDSEPVYYAKEFKCPVCGCELNDSIKFCPDCGKEVEIPKAEKFCTNCGAKMPRESKFCHSCGHEVVDPYELSKIQETAEPEAVVSDTSDDVSKVIEVEEDVETDLKDDGE